MVSVHAARDAWETLRDESIAEGRAKGIAEGRAKGIAEGREKTKRENALKMKTRGYAVEDIADITGLTAEEIATL